MKSQSDILLCRPERAAEVVAALRPKERASTVPTKKPYEVREYEDDQTLQSYRLAVVHASGVLAREVRGIYGLADYDEIASAIESADADANIDAIVLILDSPGGTVNGAPEAAARIGSIDKPLMVWSEGELCSAAYWLAASADMIATAGSAVTASIGAVLVLWDESALFQQFGVKVHVFRSGELKAAGIPGTELTEREADHFQARVDEVADDFFSWVWTYRPETDGDLMDGRAISGKKAFEMGAVDGVFVRMDDAIEEFAKSLD